MNNNILRLSKYGWKRYLLQQQKGKCYYCERQMVSRGWSELTVTIDHFIPKSIMKLGFDHYEKGNIVLACRRCNSLKANIIPGAFEMEDSYSKVDDFNLIQEWDKALNRDFKIIKEPINEESINETNFKGISWKQST